jgi:hypothetical protein
VVEVEPPEVVLVELVEMGLVVATVVVDWGAGLGFPFGWAEDFFGGDLPDFDLGILPKDSSSG